MRKLAVYYAITMIEGRQFIILKRIVTTISNSKFADDMMGRHRLLQTVVMIIDLGQLNQIQQ